MKKVKYKIRKKAVGKELMQTAMFERKFSMKFNIPLPVEEEALILDL